VEWGHYRTSRNTRRSINRRPNSRFLDRYKVHRANPF